MSAGQGLQSGTRGLVIGLFVSMCAAAVAGEANSLMDISADGQLLACAIRDSDLSRFAEPPEAARGRRGGDSRGSDVCRSHAPRGGRRVWRGPGRVDGC